MYVKLVKDYEDHCEVHYFFETKIAGDLEVTSEGKKRYQLIKKIGYCHFNKNTHEFTIDKTKTDEYFFLNKREIIHINVKLIKFNEAQEFPAVAEIACG